MTHMTTDDAGIQSRSTAFTDFLIDLSPFERLVLIAASLVTLGTGTTLLYNLNETQLVETPRDGGMFVEGISGTPRFINPLLAISDADRDLTELVYAGLLTRNAEGVLVPEIAQSYSISEDGLTYTFTLREDITFHDGVPLTSADVLYTVKQAANPELLSPVFANWKNAVVEAPDERTIVFTLPEPYVPFLDNMTLGILPKHIWEGVNPEQYRFSQFNIEPVGSGPYLVEDVVRDKSGIPATYALEAYDDYVLGTPHIPRIEFKLFDSKLDALQAFKTGEIHAVGGVPYAEVAALLDNPTPGLFSVRRVPLLRTFALFMNHNKQPLLLRDEVRTALTLATPKEAIVGEILYGYGTVLSGPLPPYMLENADSASTQSDSEEDADASSSDDSEDGQVTVPEQVAYSRIDETRQVLEKAGWKINEETGVYERTIDKETRPLSISLSVLNLPELSAVAGKVAESWRRAGIAVEVNTYESADLVQSVVRPRRFDTLMFGMVLGHELDLYAFWHSSQRNDPGLNIAQYADIEADALLEKMRTEQSAEERLGYYQEFNDLLTKQRAAIFLYMPDYVYLIRDGVGNVGLHPMTEPYERFDTIREWYMDTDKVWPILRSLE